MSGPTSKIIRGGFDEGDVTRWELPQVGERLPEPEPEPEPEPPTLTVQEIEEIQKAAYEEAYAQGYLEGKDQGQRDGYAAGERQAKELVARLEKILDGLSEPLQQVDEEVEQQLSELAMTLARQVVRSELKSQPQQIVGLVRESLALLPAASRDVKVLLHPDDAQFVRDALGQRGAQGWRLVEDAGLEPGGCHVVSAVSRIDASVRRRLAALAGEFFGAEREEDEA